MDYRFVDRTVEFAAGETRQEVPVRIFDDIFPEENRTFEVILSCSPGVYISPHSYTTVKILNDDPDLPGVCMCVCAYIYVYICFYVHMYVCLLTYQFVCTVCSYYVRM